MASRIWRIRRTVVRALVLVGLASSAVCSTACKSTSGQALQEHEPEAVGHRTGHPDYDEFFDDVYELKQQMKTAAEDEKHARAPLGDLLGGSESVDELLRRTLARIEQLSQGKKPVRLELDGIDDQGKPLAGKPITVKSIARGRLPKDAAEFAAALETTAKSEGQVYEKYGLMAEKAHRLDNRADGLLDRLEPEFPAKNKREEVKQNVVGAKGLLVQLAGRADQVVSASTKLLKGTADVLIPVIGSGKDRVVKEEKPKEHERERKPAAKPVRVAADSARSSPARKAPAAAGAVAGTRNPDGASAPPPAAAPPAANAAAGDFNP